VRCLYWMWLAIQYFWVHLEKSYMKSIFHCIYRWCKLGCINQLWNLKSVSSSLFVMDETAADKIGRQFIESSDIIRSTIFVRLFRTRYFFYLSDFTYGDVR
jgi:hypothetical protein